MGCDRPFLLTYVSSHLAQAMLADAVCFVHTVPVLAVLPPRQHALGAAPERNWLVSVALPVQVVPSGIFHTVRQLGYQLYC